jgi:hypothetical protein
MKFKKKPVVIEAKLWDGDWYEMLSWADSVSTGGPTYLFIVDQHSHHDLHVHTLEGDMKADRGDMVICGVKGEFYFCKPDIFEATYERVE